MQTLIRIFKGSPPREGEAMLHSLRTMIEFVNGVFQQDVFLAGSSAWQLKQGGFGAQFSAKTVLTAYQTPGRRNQAVTVDNGMFAGMSFPTPARCKALSRRLLGVEATS